MPIIKKSTNNKRRAIVEVIFWIYPKRQSMKYNTTLNTAWFETKKTDDKTVQLLNRKEIKLDKIVFQKKK